MNESVLKSILLTTDLIIKLLIVVLSSLIGLRFLRTLTPALSLEVFKQNIREDYIIISIKIKNVSNVGIIKKHIKLHVEKVSLFGLSNKQKDGDLLISEWINFSSSSEIFVSTTSIDPKEELYLERFYSIKADEILHVGIQVEAVRPYLSRKFSSWWPYTYRWTLTKFIK